MAISPLTLSQSDALSGLWIRVQMPAMFSLRLKVAAWLVGLAGHVAGCKVNVTTDDLIEELPECEWQIDRRSGAILVSTHQTVTPTGSRFRNWQRVPLPV